MEDEWPILKRILTSGPSSDCAWKRIVFFLFSLKLILYFFFVSFFYLAVRFGRVPKREKAKILAAMQSVNARLAEQRTLPAEFSDDVQLMQAVVRAHMDTCDFTRDKVQVQMAKAHQQPNYTACPPTLVSASLFLSFLFDPFPTRVRPCPLQNGGS